MIKNVKFIKDYRCFKQNDEFEFRPGINLLVGEQGSGKSTILTCIKEIASKNHDPKIKISATPITMMSFDFEKDCVRGKSGFRDDVSYMAQVALIFSSHGQANNAILRSLGENKNKLFIVDEPDMALSIRSCRKLVDMFKKAVENGCQILAAVHNPVVISAFDEVLSLEHRKWMKSSDFIDSHMKE
jgi:predicted ATPase